MPPRLASHARRVGRTRLSLALVGSLSLLSYARAKDASAYCRTTTVSVPADFDPIDGCWNQGNVLWWRNACVGYSIQQNAFTQWTGTACPEDEAGQSRVSIDVRDEGPVACDQVQYNQDQPNQHVILFHDSDWPYNDSSNTLALTTVTYDPDSGEIYDADMEINSTVSPIVVGVAPSDVPDEGYDFLSIVTHETGHFLGMAHSGDERATMFAHYQPGQTSMRDLTEDDVNGICAIYPPDGNRTTSVGAPVLEDSCDPTPRHSFSTECAQPEPSSCVKTTIGASASGRTSSGGTLHDMRVVAGAVGFIACVLTARRRSRRPAKSLSR
jgi:hypothetical protein